MAITVTTNPVTLTWGHFKSSPTKIKDPADGSLVDAYTRFTYELPDLPHQVIAGRFAMGDPNVLKITPNAQVYKNVLQTAGLLSHEQFHYDVGTVTARVLAREIMALREPSLAALRTAFIKAFTLHFDTRAALIQKRYDLETGHGTKPGPQKDWKDKMAACLANPKSDRLVGFWL